MNTKHAYQNAWLEVVRRCGWKLPKPFTFFALMCCASIASADWSQLAESALEQPTAKQHELKEILVHNLQSGRGIAVSDLMTEQYTNLSDATAQAHSLAVFLSQKRGRPTLLSCLREARLSSLANRWGRVFQRQYGYRDLGELQTDWMRWVNQNQNTHQMCTDSVAIAPGST